MQHKRYDQKKLATILQQIAEDVVHFWKKYGGIGIFVIALILIFGQVDAVNAGC